VRIWDPATATLIGAPLTGHSGPVRTAAWGRIGDRDVIFSGGDDLTVRIWDSATGDVLAIQDTLESVYAIAVASPYVAIAEGRAIDLLYVTDIGRTGR
jgi:WD40 repeat protein